MKRVVIIGGGISGLASAYFIKERLQDVEITLLEASSRVGGWIQSDQEGSFLFERGVRAFRSSGKGEATQELLKAINLQDEVIKAVPSAQKRYLYLNGKLKRFSPFLLLKEGLFFSLWRDLFQKKTVRSDENIASFFSRHFGKKVTESVIDPLTKGIFGGDMHALSIQACFPTLYALEQANGSLIKGLLKKKKKGSADLISIKGGMQKITDRLYEILEKHIFLNQEVISITPSLVKTKERSFEADHIVLTTPASSLQTFFPKASLSPSFQSITTVNLGWKNEKIPYQGFGFLVPSKEKMDILGMTWDSQIFEEDQARLCVMLPSKEGAKEKALQACKALLGITSPPDAIAIHEAKSAICQYHVGYLQELEEARRALPQNVHLLGSSYQGVGINDCIDAAKKLSASL